MSGHLQLIERELRDMLAKESPDAIARWVKERVLESYRNGLAAEKRPEPPASAPKPSRPASTRGRYQK